MMLPAAVESRILQNQEEMIQTLLDLIAIPSVATSAPADGYPYGAACARALDKMLGHLKDLGMSCRNYDYHMGAADWDPALPPHLGILCHLDVVPAVREGWQSDPFAPVIRNGRIYGRGAIDDKGPAVSVLFALRAIREAGIPLRKNVRFLLGCNEENGSTDLEYYHTKDSMPPQVFTPDGSYPLIHLEKGMLRLQFTKQTKDPILSFSAGTAPNAVPADVSVRLSAPLCGTAKPGSQITQRDNEIAYKGVSAHASTPESGDNAITGLLTYLSQDSAFADCAALVRLFPHGCTDGSGLGIACADTESGALTCICSMLHVERGICTGCVDIRFPICTTKEAVLQQVQSAFAAAGFACTPLIQSDPHHTPEQSPLVQTLLQVYEAQTGTPGECIAIGGGTYVHDIPGGVAFGMEYPGWDYHMHAEDEFLPLDQFLDNTRMMAAAILRICGEGD